MIFQASYFFVAVRRYFNEVFLLWIGREVTVSGSAQFSVLPTWSSWFEAVTRLVFTKQKWTHQNNSRKWLQMNYNKPRWQVSIQQIFDGGLERLWDKMVVILSNFTTEMLSTNKFIICKQLFFKLIINNSVDLLILISLYYIKNINGWRIFRYAVYFTPYSLSIKAMFLNI